MEAELATLAVSGATTVVGLMAGDAWTAAKSRVVALFRQGRSEPAAVEDELEESRRELIAARDEEDEAVAAGVQALWLMRLRRLLQENPDLAVKLQERSPRPALTERRTVLVTPTPSPAASSADP